ncbi:hypothetical protein EQH57_0987 [Dictyocoela roeselum]|nr:hypothetical protein EQH57_0987 [Dictyocoela roeselum]
MYNPSCSRISERKNSIIGTICGISRGLTLNKLIRNIFIGLNFTCHSRTGFSPYEWVYKYSPIDIFKRNLEHSLKIAKEKELIIGKNSENKRNQKRIRHAYEIGDIIF